MFVYPAITAITAGVIIILQMILFMYAATGRGTNKQGLGDGGKPDMLKRIRMHGNLIENAPIILIVMALLEGAGVARSVMAIAGAVFVLARVLHPLGLMKSANRSNLRFAGAVITMALGFAGGIYLIFVAIGRL